MRFTKCHGAGNDFVVIDARALTRDWSELARRLCDRHFGVGADGIILVAPSQKAELRMRMFNPDGSEAEACGNGLRCFVKYCVDNRLVPSAGFHVETAGGIRMVSAFPANGSPVSEAEVEMGVPRFQPEEIPASIPGPATPLVTWDLQVLDRNFQLNLVSMGNPHAVVFLHEDVKHFDLHRYGPLVEHDQVFPSRINFEVARVLGPHQIEARVWERGAGETLACGSGACAIVVAAQVLGLCRSPVQVHLPGGSLLVRWNGPGAEVLLRGPAQGVFTGEWLQ